MKKIFHIFVFFLFTMGIFLGISFLEIWQKITFNEALRLAKNQEFDRAKNLLPDSVPDFEAEKWEVFWDILYFQKAEVSEILAAYYRAKKQKNNAWLQQKIDFFEKKLPPKKSDEKKEKKFPETFENFDEESYQNVQKNLEIDQKNRENFINPYRAQESNFHKDILQIKQLLSDGDDPKRRDW